MRAVSSNDSQDKPDLIDILEHALLLARRDRSALTAHLLEMAILNETGSILEHGDTHAQV